MEKQQAAQPVSFEDCSVAVWQSRQRRIARWTKICVIVAPPLAGLFFQTTGLVVSLVGLVLAALVGGNLYAKEDQRQARTDKGRLEVTEEQLLIVTDAIDREVQLGDLEQGWRDGEGKVFLRTKGDLELTIADLSDDEQQQLLSATRLGVAERPVVLPGDCGPADTHGCAFVPAALALCGSVASAVVMSGLAGLRVAEALRGAITASKGVATVAAACGLWLLSWLLLNLMRKGKLIVGSDAVIQKGFGRKTVLTPLSEVEVDDNGMVNLKRRDGRGMPFPPPVATRIRDAKKLAHTTPTRAAHSKLDRGSRDVAQWKRDMQALTSDEVGYREAQWRIEDLVRVAEDPGQPCERRVAAAASAAAGGDEADRRKLRIMAGSCAEDDLRLALEQAAEGEIAEERLERMAKRALRSR